MTKHRIVAMDPVFLYAPVICNHCPLRDGRGGGMGGGAVNLELRQMADLLY